MLRKAGNPKISDMDRDRGKRSDVFCDMIRLMTIATTASARPIIRTITVMEVLITLKGRVMFRWTRVTVESLLRTTSPVYFTPVVEAEREIESGTGTFFCNESLSRASSSSATSRSWLASGALAGGALAWGALAWGTW